MTNRIEPQPGDRFTGHGSEWHDAKLSPEDARIATSWVEHQDRQALDADVEGARRGRARHHVAAREGRRDRGPPDPRRARAGDRQDALRLGQEDPDQATLAPQVLRPVRQHPRLSGVAAVADEPARHRVPRRDRPDLLHRLELPRLGHRQPRKPRRGVPSQLPPGLRRGQGRGPSGRLLLPAGPLRNLVRQLQGSARLSAPLGDAARARAARSSASSAGWSTASC